MERPSDVPTEPFDSLAGTRVTDRYEIHDLIGVGGTCQVYLATDTLLDIPVALKRVRPDYVHRDEFRKRMIKEARRGRIADPRIAAIHEVVTWNDEIMLVMEYVKGTSLTKTIEQGLPMRDFWRMARECLEALRAAHDKNLIHRDIKPDNIMVTEDGSIKILDFGLAHRIPGGDVDLAQSTVSVAVPAGTPRYMSPEAYRGAELDARADIFSLGVVFYQMLCGMPPFQARNWSELNDEILHFDPPPPCKNRQVSGRLSRVVMKMIAKDPDDRYASCDEVLGALEHARPGDLPVRKILWAVGILAVIGLATQAPRIAEAVRDAVKPPIPVPTVLVVMPFTSADAEPSDVAVARGLGDLIQADLRMHRDPRGYTVVDPRESREGPVDTIEDSREQLGASVALVGELDHIGRELRLNLQLRDTGPGHRSLRSALIRVESGEMPELARQAQVTVREMLGIDAFAIDRWVNAHGDRGDGPFRLYLQGLAALNADSVRAAAYAFDRTTRIQASYALAHAGLAKALVAQGHLDSASVHADLAMKLDGGSSQARMAQAAAEAAGGDTQAAIRTLEATILLEDAPLEAWLRLYGFIPTEQQAHRDRIIDDAVERWPGWITPLAYRAFYAYVGGDIEGSLPDFRAVVEAAPDYFKAWSDYGGVLAMVGRYVEAIEACQTALAIRRDVSALSNLGLAYFNLRRFEDAARAFGDALEPGDKDYRVWMNLGDAHAMYDPNEAVNDYRFAIELASSEEVTNDWSVLADLARLHSAIGDLEEAEEYLERALQIDEPHFEALESCALAAWELDQRERAIALIGRALDAGLPHPWVRDSASYDEWRQDPGFAAILSEGPS